MEELGSWSNVDRSIFAVLLSGRFVGHTPFRLNWQKNTREFPEFCLCRM